MRRIFSLGIALVVAALGISFGIVLTASSSPLTNAAIASRATATALAEAILPPGSASVPASKAPTLNHDGGAEGVQYLLDDHGFWRVPMSQADAFEFVLTHNVPGFDRSGTGEGFSPTGGTTDGVRFEKASVTLPLYSETLNYEIVSVGPNSAVLRVDANIAWAPDRPKNEYVADSATVATISRWLPYPAPAGTLGVAPKARVVIDDPAVVRHLATVFNSLGVSDGGTIMGVNCVAAEDEEVDFATSRNTAPAVSVLWNSACFDGGLGVTIGTHSSATLTDARAPAKSFVDAVAPFFGSGTVAGYLSVTPAQAGRPSVARVAGKVTLVATSGARYEAEAGSAGEFSITAPGGQYGVVVAPVGYDAKSCKGASGGVSVTGGLASTVTVLVSCSAAPRVRGPASASEWYDETGRQMTSALTGELHSVQHLTTTASASGRRELTAACALLLQNAESDFTATTSGAAKADPNLAQQFDWTTMLQQGRVIGGGCKSAELGNNPTLLNDVARSIGPLLSRLDQLESSFS